VIPGILLVVAWAALGERLRERFERWQDKLSSGSRTLLSWIVWIAGCLILLEAVDTLFTEVTVVTPWVAFAGRV
jgi:hypothetical protein